MRTRRLLASSSAGPLNVTSPTVSTTAGRPPRAPRGVLLDQQDRVPTRLIARDDLADLAGHGGARPSDGSSSSSNPAGHQRAPEGQDLLLTTREQTGPLGRAPVVEDGEQAVDPRAGPAPWRPCPGR